MKQNRVLGALIGALIGTCALGVLSPCLAHARAKTAAYLTMAPVDEYRMADRNAKIALARSAAPAAIARNAEILVFGRRGYETAVKGTNGFVCVVERSWMSPFDSPGFWNPKIRGPICFDPAAVRAVLPYSYKRTRLALAHTSKAQMLATINASIDKKEVPEVRSGALAYMLSPASYLGDTDLHWHPHLMLYLPVSAGADVGADVTNSPVIMNPPFHSAGEPVTTLLVPVRAWADGTPDLPASAHSH